MNTLHKLAATFFFLTIMIGNANADPILEGRLPITPGGTDYQAYYDPFLDITWAADASLTGFLVWDEALAWAAGLDIGGVTGWRLPITAILDPSCSNAPGNTGIGCSESEMGSLFSRGITFATPGPFSGLLSLSYWSMTVAASDLEAFFFNFNSGFQFIEGKAHDQSVWAVYSGDVSAVPLPGALLLFGSGLLGLFRIRTRFLHTQH